MIVCVICTYPNRNILCQMNVIIINEIYMLSMQKICLYTLGRLIAIWAYENFLEIVEG